MKDISKMVNELNQNTDYEKMLYEVVNSKENNAIREILEEVSISGKLERKQKDRIYNAIFDYTKKATENLKNTLETIHKRAFKEGIIMSSYMIEKLGKEGTDKLDENLELELQDFIIKRLESENTLEDNVEYIENRKNIKNIKQNANKRIVEDLENLYNLKCHMETIDAYKIGLIDATKFFSNRSNVPKKDNILYKGANYGK